MELGLLEEAKDDLMQAYKLAPTDKAVRVALADYKQKKKDAKAKEKAAFGGLFGKVSMYDEKKVRDVIVRLRDFCTAILYYSNSSLRSSSRFARRRVPRSSVSRPRTTRRSTST